MEAKIADLIGKTMTTVTGTVGGDEIRLTTTNGEEYRLFHCQDCCESVYIEDICGNLEDLIGAPLLIAREDSNCTDTPPDGCDESYTWTFYNFATIKGHVTIRWFGESNGYYSEGVDFAKLEPIDIQREHEEDCFAEQARALLTKYGKLEATDGQ